MNNIYSAQQAAAQNATGLSISAYDMWNQVRPGASISKQSRIAELQSQLVNITAQLEKLTLDDPMEAPTQRMLNNNEALKNAYSEMLVIWKLAGKGV